MPSNIEIKAKVYDPVALERRVAKIADTSAKILEQQDTFFRTVSGRLKLREAPTSYAELIYYERPDSRTPTESQYCLIKIDEPEALKNALGAAIGIRGVVRKTRRLYLVGQTRIHLDHVEKLGNFMELEVVLRKDQSLRDGQQIAEQLMSELKISPSQLLQSAYIDMLDKQESEIHNSN